MGKGRSISNKVKEEIKKMYESGVSTALIVSSMKTMHNVDVSANSIRHWGSVNKWVRPKGSEKVEETITSLPASIKSELEKLEKTIEGGELDTTDLLSKMGNLFDNAYKELYSRLSNKNVAMTLEIDDLIKVLKTSSDALLELKKANKKAGNVYIQFNINFDDVPETFIENQVDDTKKVIKEVEDISQNPKEDPFDNAIEFAKSVR